MKDVSSRVIITPAVLAAWQALAQQAIVPLLASQKIRPEEIPNEEIHECEDGELEIVAVLPRGLGEVRMHIPREHWSSQQ